MMAAADATTDLKVGCLVHDNDYKHPVVLAKEIATIDVLSNGRVEFGIGAGWMNTDYAQSGIPKDRDGVRIARMAEGLEIYRGLWADGPFSFSGEHYTITDLDGMPKPVQKPGPPILIGGGGPKVLGIAARHADIIGVNPAIPAGEVTLEAGAEMLPDRVDTKLEWIRDAAGTRFDDLELNVLVFFASVTDERKGRLESMARMLELKADDLAESPYYALVGTVEEIADNVRAARERWGISYYCVQGPVVEKLAPVVALLSGT
jgi:probable F420-dependent oxidoreductase